MGKINGVLSYLIESDIDTFKSYLIRVYTESSENKLINIFTLKTLLKRYSNYQHEDENSWVDVLINRCKEFQT